jgi:mRNA interferase MazF
MGAFASRQVILLPFPFSDLSASKLRPALLMASAGKGDWVLCQITSNPYADAAAVVLTDADFVDGSLQRISYVRPGKMFTANETLFKGRAGTLTADKHIEVVNVIVEMLRAGV